jgi:hypothetical protein
MNPKNIESLENNSYQHAKLLGNKLKDLVINDYNSIDGAYNPELLIHYLNDISNIEKGKEKQLEQFAIKLIKDEYNIDDEIEFQVRIVPPGNIQTKGFKREEEIKNIKHPKNKDLSDEINKRRIINSMIQGSARMGEKIFFKDLDKLKQINPSLPNLYKLFLNNSNLFYWYMDDLFLKNIGGYGHIGFMKIRYKGNTPVIIAEGINLPTLLHEMVKGVMEVISQHGLPKDKEDREYVVSKSDFFESEFWDLRVGPAIWKKFLDSIDAEQYEIMPLLYNEIVKLPAKEFNQFMKDLIDDNINGRKKLQSIANKINNEINEYERGDEGYDEISLKDLGF